MKLRRYLLAAAVAAANTAGVSLLGGGLRGPTIALSAGATDEQNAPRWVQCADAGDFKGHSSGSFKFDAKVFDELIKNFRRHPSYKKGADGYGEADVIPFDFHHANEADASRIAAMGAPAQGWVLDLESRMGADGEPELWALGKWLEPARTYIREGRYKWLSVAVWPKAVDAKSGAEIGWYMSSIALTNDPFIQGMKPITASYMHDPYSRPSTPEEVLECIVEIFDLPWSSSRDDVMAELDKLEDAARGRATGIPQARVTEVLGALAQCLNLPVMTPGEDVVRAAQKLVGQATASTSTPAAMASKRKNDMSILVKLAATLGIANSVILAAREDDPKSQAALEFEVERATNAALLERVAAEKTTKALFESLGVVDEKTAIAKVIDLLTKEKALADIQPEIDQAKKDKEAAALAAIETDVADVVEAMNMPKSAIPALRLARKSDPEQFKKDYPLPDKSMRHITKTLTSGDRSRVGEGEGEGNRQPQTPKDLLAFSGRNDLERAIACVRSKPGGDKLSWEDANVRGNELLRELRAG